MPRYRAPHFAELVETYRRAVDDHLAATTSDAETGAPQATFDNAWFRDATNHLPRTNPIAMELCDESD